MSEAAAGRPKSMSFGGAKKCASCNKSVYPVEMIVADEKVFHKTGCFKCTHCQKTLSPGNYAGMGGVYYCKPHFKQLFALKGNYDEGFGKEQHKKKWLEENGGAASSNPEAASGIDSTLTDSAPQTPTSASAPAPAAAPVPAAEPAAEEPAAAESAEPAAEEAAAEPAAEEAN